MPKTPEHVQRQRMASWTARQRAHRIANAPSPRSDAELIAEAVEKGRVTKLPDGTAHGALHWGVVEKTNTGGNNG